MTPPRMPEAAYKIVDAAEWRAAVAEGRYDGAPVDIADGYIHMSTEAQLAETARRHFAGRSDLLLLTVDLSRFGDDLVWEPSRGGDLFPHIHGDLPLTAVGKVRGLAIDDAGSPRFAEGVTTWPAGQGAS